jgi:hypothetical protein
MITSDVPEVVSPVMVKVEPEDQVPVLSGALPESKAGLGPIATLCEVPVSAEPELVANASHLPLQPAILELPR